MENEDLARAFHQRDKIVHEAIKECAHHAAQHPRIIHMRDRVEAQCHHVSDELSRRARERHQPAT